MPCPRTNQGELLLCMWLAEITTSCRADKTMTFSKAHGHVSQYPNTFYRVTVKAVIRNQIGEVLVNKEQDSTTWSLPGGGWDHGETDKEALARELYEEVGYEGEFSARPIATQTFWLETKQAWLLWIVYDVTTKNQNFVVGDDSSTIAYVKPDVFRNSDSRAELWIYEHLRS